jgi:hypothetical protein
MKLSLIALLLAGCANSVSDPLNNSGQESIAQKEAPVEVYSTETKSFDPDACVPDVFASNAVPIGYQLDPNCPPRIFDPPKFSLPGDPGPVIK